MFTRICEFLPRLKQANEDLHHRPAEEFNMENVAKGERHIKMELGLGVFDLRDSQNKENISLNETEITSSFDDLTSSEESSDSESSNSEGANDSDSSVNKHVLIEDITNLR